MAKSLCKLKKKCRKDFDQYASLVDRPKHVCLKCGRAANRKKNLCNSRPIESNR